MGGPKLLKPILRGGEGIRYTNKLVINKLNSSFQLLYSSYPVKYIGIPVMPMRKSASLAGFVPLILTSRIDRLVTKAPHSSAYERIYQTTTTN
jgi:hypothetical protein